MISKINDLTKEKDKKSHIKCRSVNSPIFFFIITYKLHAITRFSKK